MHRFDFLHYLNTNFDIQYLHLFIIKIDILKIYVDINLTTI